MSKEYLTFTLDGSQYAAEVYKVQEVLEYTKITKVPCAASYVEGLINSRGQGISVVNLRKKFAMTDVEPGKDTRIIVFEISGENGVTPFGAIADSVQEVIGLDDAEVEGAPRFGNTVAERFIRGIGKKDGAFIIILDIDKIFTEDEAEALEQAASSAPLETQAT